MGAPPPLSTPWNNFTRTYSKPLPTVGMQKNLSPGLKYSKKRGDFGLGTTGALQIWLGSEVTGVLRSSFFTEQKYRYSCHFGYVKTL